MSVTHVKSVTIGDFTGTVTVYGSTGGTETIAATNLVRPSDWNSGHAQLYTLSGNTAGNSTVSGTNVVWQGGNNVTLSGTGSTIIVSGGAGGAGVTATMWQPFNEGVNVIGLQGQATMHIAPLPTPPTAAGGEVQLDRLAIPIYWTNATNSTGSATLSLWFGLYTRNGTSLSRMHSTSYSKTHAYAGAGSSATFNGIRLHTIPWTTTIPDGRYYVANVMRSTYAGANGTHSQVLVSQLNSNFSGIFGTVSNASYQWPLGWGVYSASTTALPDSMGFSQIYGSASLAARPPSWFMISSTA